MIRLVPEKYPGWHRVFTETDRLESDICSATGMDREMII